MNVVYWTVVVNDQRQPRSMEFKPTDLVSALNFSESLRKHKREGLLFEGELVVGYITTSCENPDSVGEPGVSSPPADYSWSKQHRGAGPAKAC